MTLKQYNQSKAFQTYVILKQKRITVWNEIHNKIGDYNRQASIYKINLWFFILIMDRYYQHVKYSNNWLELTHYIQINKANYDYFQNNRINRNKIDYTIERVATFITKILTSINKGNIQYINMLQNLIDSNWIYQLSLQYYSTYYDLNGNIKNIKIPVRTLTILDRILKT